MHPSQINPPSARRREDDIFTTRAFATSCCSGPLPLQGIFLTPQPPRLRSCARPSRPLAFSRPNPNTFASPYFKDERVDLWLERGKPNGASDRRGYKLSCFSMPFFRARENRHAGARLCEGKQASRSSRRDRFGFREAEGGGRMRRKLITGC